MYSVSKTRGTRTTPGQSSGRSSRGCVLGGRTLIDRMERTRRSRHLGSLPRRSLRLPPVGASMMPWYEQRSDLAPNQAALATPPPNCCVSATALCRPGSSPLSPLAAQYRWPGSRRSPAPRPAPNPRRHLPHRLHGPRPGTDSARGLPRSPQRRLRHPLTGHSYLRHRCGDSMVRQ